MSYIISLCYGLLLDFVTTVMAVFFPLVIGIVLSLVIKKKPVIGKVASWFNIPFAAIFVPVALLICYYLPSYLFGINLMHSFEFYILNFHFPLASMFIIACVCAFAYLLYMPSRYNHSWSFVKNVTYYGLGLISSVFKWVCISGAFLSIGNMLSIGRQLFAHYYNMFWYIIPFLVYGIILVVIELIRVLVKQLMK